MKQIDTLLKLLASPNIAEELDEERRQEIADDVILGTEIDEETRETWLQNNLQAVKIIEQEGENASGTDLYEGQCKVVYPLLAPAIVQLAARLSTHTVRNNRTMECAVLGPDKQIPDPKDVARIQQLMQQQAQQPQQPQQAPQAPQAPQGQLQAPQQGQQSPQQSPQGQQQMQPKMIWEKADRAKRTSDYINYKKLIESDTWVSEDHKLNSIVAGWGTGFKQVYYDFVTKTNKSEILSPENVIINHNVTSLEQAPRITVKHYLTKNQIIENINAGYFLDIDIDLLQKSDGDEDDASVASNNSREKQPVYEFLCQTCYLDLDEDEQGYLEPYKVYVNTGSKKLVCIVPAFDASDIIQEEPEVGKKPSGKIIAIKRRLDIVDQHLIDSPNGKYWSLGLNSLLLHSNKAITSILRQLIDAGTLANAAKVSGFVTKAFQTKERDIRIKLGSFHVVDCNPMVTDPTKQIFPMPFGEPSQVLLALLQFLVDASQKNGFISDILTGDVEMQNVPATTAMAMVEQSTRAFKPIIENKYISLKKEFKIEYYLYSKHLNKKEYALMEGQSIEVAKEDFNQDSLEICPVADPTLSSEAHGFAQAKGLVEAVQAFGSVMNMKEAATRFFTQFGFEKPEMMVQDPAPPGPDPKLVAEQNKAQAQQQKNQIDQQLVQIESQKLENQKLKLQLDQAHNEVKAMTEHAKIAKMGVDAQNTKKSLDIQQQEADTNEKSLVLDAAKIHASIEIAKSKNKEGNK